MTKKYAKNITISLTAENLKAVEDWRRKQPEIPSISQTINSLILIATNIDNPEEL